MAKPVYYICSRSKVKGHRSRSWGQSSRSQRNVTYQQEKRSKAATDRLNDFKLGTGDELKRVGTARRRAASFAIAAFSSLYLNKGLFIF